MTFDYALSEVERALNYAAEKSAVDHSLATRQIQIAGVWLDVARAITANTASTKY